jgi:hypothetical protein
MDETETSIKYYFNSTGPRGVIPLVLEFRWYRDNLWEVGYGVLKDDGTASYMAITNNSDSKRILEFVLAKIRDFSEKYPDAKILLLGSTSARIRLFKMAAVTYLADYGNKIIAC